jgi:aminoglycoside/choline kinase family phosphotransferase
MVVGMDAAAAGVAVGGSEDEFLRWFDFMGVQRHLKVLGIFARLWHRDGKPGYLKDLPLTLRYVRDVVDIHPELAPLSRLIAERLLEPFERVQTRLGSKP